MIAAIRVLVVDCYSDSSGKGKPFAKFRAAVQNVLKQCNVSDPKFIYRRLNDLEDYAVDWEHDRLNEQAKACAKKFDSLDVIFVSGDMSILPWDPRSTLLVSILNMANKTNKPVFACGSGAYAAIYATSAQGARYYMLNGVRGGKVADIPLFPRYAVSGGSFPGGFFDEETGDVYCYNAEDRVWEPTCNIGLHYTSDKMRPFDVIQPRTRASMNADSETTLRDEYATIRNIRLHHPFVAPLNGTGFLYTPFCLWMIHKDGALPPQFGLEVLAENSSHTPILLAQRNMCIFAAEVNEGESRVVMDTVMLAFMQHMIRNVLTNSESFISLLSFLFGPGGNGGCTYDSIKDRDVNTKCRPLASATIRTKVHHGGPVKVDIPVMSLFHVHRPYDEGAIYPQRELEHTTIDKPVKLTIQNPRQKRSLRLHKLLDICGYGEMAVLTEVMESVGRKLDPYGRSEPVPDVAKQMLSGVMMDATSVSVRLQSRPQRPQHEIVGPNMVHLVSPRSGYVDLQEKIESGEGPGKVLGIANLKPPIIIGRSTTRLANVKPGEHLYVHGEYDVRTGRVVRQDSDGGNLTNPQSQPQPPLMMELATSKKYKGAQSRRVVTRPLSANAFHRTLSTQEVLNERQPGYEDPRKKVVKIVTEPDILIDLNTPITAELDKELLPKRHPKPFAATAGLASTAISTRKTAILQQQSSAGAIVVVAPSANKSSNNNNNNNSSGHKSKHTATLSYNQTVDTQRRPFITEYVTLIRAASAKPYNRLNSFNELEKKVAEEDDNKGWYKDGITWKSEFEKEIEENKEARKFDIAGAFKY